jgi:hypothetical protein
MGGRLARARRLESARYGMFLARQAELEQMPGFEKWAVSMFLNTWDSLAIAASLALDGMPARNRRTPRRPRGK